MTLGQQLGIVLCCRLAAAAEFLHFSAQPPHLPAVPAPLLARFASLALNFPAAPTPVQGMLSAGSTDGSQAGGSSTGGSSLTSVRLLSSFGLRPPVALAGLHLGPKLGR